MSMVLRALAAVAISFTGRLVGRRRRRARVLVSPRHGAHGSSAPAERVGSETPGVPADLGASAAEWARRWRPGWVGTAIVIALAGVCVVGLTRLHPDAAADNSPTAVGHQRGDPKENGHFAAALSVRPWLDAAIQRGPDFASVVYPQVEHIPGEAPSGAVSVNAAWERGERTTWFIEEQAQDSALIDALILNDVNGARAALRAYTWGFSHQRADGSFPGVPDAFHSTSYFVESVAYSSLFVISAPRAGIQVPASVSQGLAALRQPLERAATWMARNDVLHAGLARDATLTHRRFLVASALGLTGALTENARLRTQSRSVIEDGLTHQWANGVLPEAHAFDSSYQMIGITYAERWLAYAPKDQVAAQVAVAIGRGLSWEATRIEPSGEVIAAGNARVNGVERDRAGKIKAVASPYVVRAFAYWGAVTHDPRWARLARRVADRVERLSLAHASTAPSLREAGPSAVASS